MDVSWTLSELVAEAIGRLDALPAPKNGQVRAVPDERTIRYYASIGLVDRPAAMRGRTALYGARHLAQVVAIKRMQSAGHSLAHIQQVLPTLDDQTLSRVSGVHVTARPKTSRYEFWKREIDPPVRDEGALPRARATQPRQARLEAPPHAEQNVEAAPSAARPSPAGSSPAAPSAAAPSPAAPSAASLRARLSPYLRPDLQPTLQIGLVDNVALVIALAGDATTSVSSADVRALRAAAAPLVDELAKRGLLAPALGTLEEEP